MPNFEFIASTVREIRRGSQNSEIGSRDPLVTHIDLISHFFRYFPSESISMPNIEFLDSTVPEIRMESQNSKTGSLDPLVTPIDLICHFFSFVPLVVHMHAKFRVSSFYLS